LTIDKVENESLFVHFEQMSRSIYLLEKMKMSVREENAFSVMELLNDDKYLTVNDLQMTEILGK
jgi:environmental stress-induced protein Ves